MDYAQAIKSRFREVFERNLNLSNPVTFNEKLLSMSINLSTEELSLRSRCADKIKVRNYFIEQLGHDIGIPIEGIYSNVIELKDLEFSSPKMVKCNHGSGMNFICKNIVTTKQLNLLKSCLMINWAEKSFELWYKFIDRKIMIEPLLDNIRDIRVYCFNGKAKLYEVCCIHNEIKAVFTDDGAKFLRMERNFPENRLTYYDLSWKYMPELKRTRFGFVPEQLDACPKYLDLMTKQAEILAKPFKFVRIDYLLSNEEPFCEEITFCPGAGFSPFDGNGDRILGELLEI